MITDKRELAKLNIASILDWPSVFMGGPSQQNLKRAEKILQSLESDGLFIVPPPLGEGALAGTFARYASHFAFHTGTVEITLTPAEVKEIAASLALTSNKRGAD